MTDAAENPLGREPVGRLFVRLALPAVTAQVINVLYNLVDQMYIGHIPDIGGTALTGVGVTSPVILLLSAFAALVSMGGAPRASIALGRGDRQEAEQILGSCAFTLTVLSLVLTAVMLLWARPILLLFGASAETLPYALPYMRVYSLGTVFVQLTLGLNAFITAQGFSLKSMLTVLIGAVLNSVLDPLFIYPLGLGVAGAAWATIVSQAVSAVWVIRFLCSKKTGIRLRRDCLGFHFKTLLPCLALGASPCLMQITENLVAISFDVCLLRYAGDVAVGAVTILCSIMNFTMLLITGLTQGAQPILGFNLGARRPERVRRTFRLLLAACVTGSACIWAACMFAPRAVAHIFTNSPELVDYTVWALRIFMSMSLIFGVQIACQYSLVALDDAPTAIAMTIYRKLLLLIPLIFLLPRFVPDPAMGVLLAEPVSDTLAVCTTSTVFFFRFRKQMREIS